MLRLRLLVPFAGLLLLAGCDWEDFGASDRYSEDFHYSYALQPGGRLSVENYNGTIDITGWDQPNVDISGSKFASSPEARDAIKIDVHADSGAVSIRTIRPSASGSRGGARYILRVPRRVELDRVTSTNGSIRINQIDGAVRLKTTNGALRASAVSGTVDGGTTNGSIELDGIQGDCTVKTTNGRIKAEAVRGSFDASTRNGAVDVSVDEMRSSGVRVSTSNGGITVRLPSRINARLMAKTSNAAVSTDFELHSQGETSKHRLEGTIGTGGPLVDLSTTNGGIHVVRQGGV